MLPSLPCTVAADPLRGVSEEDLQNKLEGKCRPFAEGARASSSAEGLWMYELIQGWKRGEMPRTPLWGLILGVWLLIHMGKHQGEEKKGGTVDKSPFLCVWFPWGEAGLGLASLNNFSGSGAQVPLLVVCNQALGGSGQGDSGPEYDTWMEEMVVGVGSASAGLHLESPLTGELFTISPGTS